LYCNCLTHMGVICNLNKLTKEHYLKIRRYNTSNILNFRDYLLIIFIVVRNIDIIVMEL